MKCPKCLGRARVRNSYSVNEGGTQSVECLACDKVFTYVTICLGESTRGKGAYAVAKRWEKGERPIEPPTE